MEGQHRGGVDDGAFARGELVLRCQAHAHRAGEIDLDRQPEGLDLEFLAAALDHAGAVDQRVDALAAGDDRCDLRIAGDVEAGMTDGGMGGRRRDLLLCETGGEDLVAGLGECKRGAGADAAGAAGDEGEGRGGACHGSNLNRFATLPTALHSGAPCVGARGTSVTPPPVAQKAGFPLAAEPARKRAGW